MSKQGIGKVQGVPLAPAIRSGNLVLVSGQVPLDPATGRAVADDVGTQTRAVPERTGALVEQAGGAVADIVETTVVMTDIAQFGRMNRVYGEFFGDHPPARSTFEVKHAVDVDVEIEAIAVLPG